MVRLQPDPKLLSAAMMVCLCWLVCPPLTAALPANVAQVQSATVPLAFTLDTAIRWALANNPEVAAFRQQHGIAAAEVVIARTYPFNLIWENRVQQASGPASAGITNNVPIESLLLWEVEIRGQRGYRRQQAAAGLSRTDWEIAQQEQLLAVRVIRAFQTLLYQQEKLRLLEETVRLDEQLVANVQKLFQNNQLRGADVILAQTEADDARAQLGLGRTSLTTARYDLLRTLGIVDTAVEIRGTLPPGPYPLDGPSLTLAALAARPDLRARQAALAEAEARVSLTVADRFGNPVIGPAFTYDPTRVSAAGAQINFPLPVFNTHRGEIDRSEAQLAQAALELRQAEVLVRQDVEAALARLRVAQARVELYRSQLLPSLQKGLEDIQRLFTANDPGVDVLRVIDVQRKLLRARDTYLDAQWEWSQAHADLIAAVGDLGIPQSPADEPEVYEVLPPLKP